MDKETREKFIRQLITISEVADNEIRILADNDEYKMLELHNMFNSLSLFLRLHEAPISHPHFSDILRLAANIIDLTREQSKGLSNEY